MSAYRLLVLFHVIAGTAALISYWSAAIARKGSLRHRRIGQAFLIAMLGVTGSAVPIAIVFLIQGRVGIGVFLAYLVVITGTAMWSGWNAIRSKRDIRGYLTPAYRALAWFNIVAGLVVFGIGLQLSSVLLSTFCWIGVLGGVGMLRQLAAPPEARNWWLKEHYSAMIANGVATHIAFLGLGLNRLLGPLGVRPPEEFAWLAPVVVAVVARIYLRRRYGEKRIRPAVRPAAAFSRSGGRGFCERPSE